MEKENLTKKLIQKYQQKQDNKPCYDIEKLYVGSIVKVKDQPLVQSGLNYNIVEERINDYAICIKDPFGEYHHIASCQNFERFYIGQQGKTVISNPKPFNRVFAHFIAKHNLKQNAKLSKAQIIALEQEFIQQNFDNKKAL